MVKIKRVAKFSILLFCFMALSGMIIIKATAQTPDQTDAIAVRVIPNPEHYSPMQWYQKQGYSGSPSPTTVDGYPAVRDGRTVYVNVANSSGGNLYTNIYLISYTQEGTSETTQIFDQMLDHWRFNTNMTEVGTCFGQDNEEERCLSDDDCSGGGYCDSEKAKLARDTRRLGDIVYLREAINSYKSRKGKFPELQSGTYLPGRTISTWPSWQKEFSSELGIDVPTDPVNKLGVCDPEDDDYDPETCWDDENNEFADPDTSNNDLDLPPGSNALVYEVKDEGQSYNMCGYMESGLVAQLGGEFGSCTESTRGNDAPKIDCGTLLGFVGEPFEGYVSASDPNNDPVDITISGLSSGFNTEDEPSKGRVRIYNTGPSKGEYNFTVTAEDTYGAEDSRQCKIMIEDEEFIVYPIPDQDNLVGREFGFTVYANHSKKDYAGIDFDFNVSNSSYPLGCYTMDELLDGRVKCEVKGTIGEPVDLNVTVSAENGSGDDSTEQSFRLNIYNEPPVITEPLSCDTNMRVGQGYSDCLVSATDPNGHNITEWNLTQRPPGIEIAPEENGQGRIYGDVTTAGIHTVSFTAQDQYGLDSDSASFELSVNTYCGDGEKQSPNMEGKNGPGNDGYEDCDNGDGVPRPHESDVSWQYGCKDNCTGKSDGYCDDGLVQDGHPEKGVETLYKWSVDGDGAAVELEHSGEDYKEQCDDNNDIPNDGCDTQGGCYWTCGDGMLNDGEGTGGYWKMNIVPEDDQVRADKPSCRNLDTQDDSDTPCWISEECDDGNEQTNDGCNTESTGCQFVCGDGYLNNNESCEVDEEGNDILGGRTCQDLIGGISGRTFDEGDLTCQASSCDFDTTDCFYLDSVSGNIKNALNYDNLSGVQISVTLAGRTYTGTTDSSGNFTMDMPHKGGTDLEINFSKTGFRDGNDNINLSGTLTDLQYYMFPSDWDGLGAIIMTMTSDDPSMKIMDTHIKFGPHHLYYVTTGCTCKPGCPNQIGGSLSMDVDNCGDIGHETVTIDAVNPGTTYHYYIDSYSNKNFTPNMDVRVFRRVGGEAVLERAYTAINSSEEAWEVFSFRPTVSGGVITDFGITDIDSYTTPEPTY